MFQMEGGEHEKMTPEELKKFCPVGKVTKIECTTINNVSSISNAEQLTCKLDSGLQCENADNFPAPCSDYRVRYFCHCEDQPITTPKAPCKEDKWSEYVNNHTPTSEMFSNEGGEHEKMTPEELKKFCPVGKVTKIECTTINNVSSISNAEQLTCKLDSGLQCENADNFPAPCSDYRVRYFCQCPQICKDMTCPALVKPPLDVGEDVKIALTTDGCCRQYVKVCNSHLCPVSEENCETPKYLIQNGGTNCCPKFTCKCPDKCPVQTDPVCLKASKLIEINTECNCKQKFCVPLVPECRYRMTSLAELKSFKAGETWNDGLCKSCTCTKLSDGNVQTSCQNQQCSPCKPGEKKVTQPNKCCSDCQPIGCYMDGKIYKEGETMPSTLKCHSKQCIRDTVHGSFVVRESQTTCLALDKLPPCITDVVVYDSSGCCATCVPKTSTNSTDTCHSCQPKLMFTHPKQSVGYFTVTDNGEKCQNSQPISDLKLCSGSCDSSSTYTDIMSGVKNTCSCCQPTKTNVQNVQLACSSGRTITKSYDIPEACACGLCS
ncbi:mucin-2-like isoform X1 [Patella vulgata]|uniref:mucin-2-like isoform X1 n=1 Tax=Patella vulgata TaxID=6465 RepID=UPI0024A80735|nr:mucin-2-like isoform X1 [Patella vulgata]